MPKFCFYNATVSEFAVVQIGPLGPLVMTVTEREHTQYFFFSVGPINVCSVISEKLRGYG